MRYCAAFFLCLLLFGTANADVNRWGVLGHSTDLLYKFVVDPTGPYLDYLIPNSGATFYRTRNELNWTTTSPVPTPTGISCTPGGQVIAGSGVLFAQRQSIQTACNGSWKSADGGDTWLVIPPLPGEMVAAACDPTNPAIIYALILNLGVYKSEDGGLSWTQLPVAWPQFGYQGIIVDAYTPSTVYIYGDRSAVLRSDDAGVDWQDASNGLPPVSAITDVNSMVQLGPGVLVAAVGRTGPRVYRTLDGGKNWTPVTGPGGTPIEAGVYGFAFIAASRGPNPRLYTEDDSGRVMFSADAGDTWTVGEAGLGTGSLFGVSQLNPSVPFALSNGLALSLDAGNHWVQTSTNTGLPAEPASAVLLDGSPQSPMYANFGDGERSPSAGNQWSRLQAANGDSIIPFAASAAHRGSVYGLSTALYRSDDSGVTWISLAPFLLPSANWVAVADSATSDTIYAAGYVNTSTSGTLQTLKSHVERSGDGGQTWADVSAGLPFDANADYILSAFAVDPANADIAYAATPGKLYKTTNGGANWSVLGQASFPTSLVSALVADPRETGHLLAASATGLWESKDAGASWTVQDRTAGMKLTALSIDPNDSATLYIAADGQGVFRSTDGGADWTALNEGLPTLNNLQISTIAVDALSRQLFIGAAIGLFRYTIDTTGQSESVVEFYNQGLDRYMLSADPQEISDLDQGVHPGWIRTGQSFAAYRNQIGAANPVCRFYLPPPYGDSHFFSASPAECAAVQTEFPEFIEETATAFYIDLPDSASGLCPDDDNPVYRVWNGQAQANHRYVTDINTRDWMVALGGIAEGYGPSITTMCAAP